MLCPGLGRAALGGWNGRWVILGLQQGEGQALGCSWVMV